MAVVTRAARSTPRAKPTPVVAWLTRKNRGWYTLAYVLLAILSIWTIFPFYWQLATSLRADVDLYSSTVALIPHTLTTEHYARILARSAPFSAQFMNSVFVALGTTLVSIVLGAMAGYALTRLKF